MVKIVSEISDIPQEGIVVIDFFATWCGPCKTIAPKFEEMADLYPTITFLKVDVDESQELTELYDVSVMPTFIFLRNGQPVETIEGADIRRIGTTLERLAAASK